MPPSLKLLVKKKCIAADYKVCACAGTRRFDARTVSLAENLLCEQMHPAGQFVIFAALVKEGRPVEDIVLIPHALGES